MTTQLKFTPEIQKELNYERYHYPVPLVMRRMEVLWIKSQGLAHEQIATLAGISENTMREYFSLYEEGGVEKLKELNYYHPESAMNEHILKVGTNYVFTWKKISSLIKLVYDN